MIEVMDDVSIPEQELTFTASRSRGPGGQNVNKVNTRVTLRFNVATSPSLSEMQKQHLLRSYPSRVNQEGVFQVVSQRHRSQAANRQVAVSHFVALLRDALTPASPRHPTSKPLDRKSVV